MRWDGMSPASMSPLAVMEPPDSISDAGGEGISAGLKGHPRDASRRCLARRRHNHGKIPHLALPVAAGRPRGEGDSKGRGRKAFDQGETACDPIQKPKAVRQNETKWGAFSIF